MRLFGCSMVALAMASSGAGARTLDTTIQDDAVLLHRSPAQVRQAARQMAALGADHVRITAGWSALAPAPHARRRPGRPFDPGRSTTYPPEPMSRLDRAVREASAAGLAVQLDLAFWAPRWAVARGGPQPERERYIPDAREFGRFASAMARRYSGATRDPASHNGRRLPAVRLWTTWNEPNHVAFLAPQWKRTRAGGHRPFSPHVYRTMHVRAYDAIKAASPANRVLIGGTAPKGAERRGHGNVAPLEFLRTMACVDGVLRPLRVPECRGADPLRADGYAHHPYTRRTPPGVPADRPGDAVLADTGRLSALIGRLADRGRIDARWPIYATEYGYESSPPDPTAPYGLAQQARFLAEATDLAYHQSATRMFSQFLLRDIDERESGFPPGNRRRWRDFQTGLEFRDGRFKPAARAFKLPFTARITSDGLRFFGGVRPGTGAQVVRVEREVSAAWMPLRVVGPACEPEGAEFATDAEGWFERSAAPADAPATARYRLAWRHADGRWEPGVPAAVAAPAAPGG